MTWPTALVDTTGLDAPTDTPPRAAILDLVQKFNQVLQDPPGAQQVWTPELRFGASTTGITYGVRAGRYAVVGDLVFCDLRFALTNKGSAAGAAQIAGLPFAYSGGGYPPALMFGEFSNMAGLGAGAQYACYQMGASNLLQVVQYQHTGSASNPLQVTNTSFNNNSIIHLNFWYRKA